MSKTFGTREEVFNGDAKKTRGGLHKEALMMNQKGKVVSIKKYESGIKLYKNMKTRLCGTIDEDANKAIIEDTKKILQSKRNKKSKN